jgi:predicted nuclease of predicted toxin-antitoxin system
VRLKLDENLGRRWSHRFRDGGHDVDTVVDEHLSGASASALLDAAVAAERALVSLDVDFANPFQFPPNLTFGIAVLRVEERPGRCDVELVVDRLVEGLSRGELRGRLWVVEPDRIRQYEQSTDDRE